MVVGSASAAASPAIRSAPACSPVSASTSSRWRRATCQRSRRGCAARASPISSACGRGPRLRHRRSRPRPRRSPVVSDVDSPDVVTVTLIRRSTHGHPRPLCRRRGFSAPPPPSPPAAARASTSPACLADWGAARRRDRRPRPFQRRRLRRLLRRQGHRRPLRARQRRDPHQHQDRRSRLRRHHRRQSARSDRVGQRLRRRAGRTDRVVSLPAGRRPGRLAAGIDARHRLGDARRRPRPPQRPRRARHVGRAARRRPRQRSAAPRV